jgi:hypothetical protein
MVPTAVPLRVLRARHRRSPVAALLLVAAPEPLPLLANLEWGCLPRLLRFLSYFIDRAELPLR